MFQRHLRPFRVVALLSVRNERHYIGRCLEHLAEQGVKVCVIDNDSTDGTSAIIEGFSRELVLRHVHHPYPGYYDWVGILRLKQELAREIGSNWFIHCDADEILEPPIPHRSLKEALRLVGRKGYNAINFDEFVFVPSSAEEHWEGQNYVEGMSRYYYFCPEETRLVRAWANTGAEVDIVSSGGHQSVFEGRRIYPESFVLRHYIGLSLDHLVHKYSTRRFAPDELANGWHHNRVGLQPDQIKLPSWSKLHSYTFARRWDRSDPWLEHFFSTTTADPDEGGS